MKIFNFILCMYNSFLQFIHDSCYQTPIVYVYIEVYTCTLYKCTYLFLKILLEHEIIFIFCQIPSFLINICDSYSNLKSLWIYIV